MIRTLLWRFAIPTFAAIAIAAWVAVPHVESMITDWFGTDIALRARLVMSSIEDPLAELVDKHSPARLKQFLSKVTADERLLGVLVCRPDGKPIFQTEAVPAQVSLRARRGRPVAAKPGHPHAEGLGSRRALRYRPPRTVRLSAR